MQSFLPSLDLKKLVILDEFFSWPKKILLNYKVSVVSILKHSKGLDFFILLTFILFFLIINDESF